MCVCIKNIVCVCIKNIEINVQMEDKAGSTAGEKVNSASDKQNLHVYRHELFCIAINYYFALSIRNNVISHRIRIR